jgi:hypothetical protein
MRPRRVFFCALVALAGEACSSSTGPQYNITGLWQLETPTDALYGIYQLAQSGSKVAGFTTGGLPRIGVCGSVQGTAVHLYFLPDSLVTFAGTVQPDTEITGTLSGGARGEAWLNKMPGNLETGGGYPNC